MKEMKERKKERKRRDRRDDVTFALLGVHVQSLLRAARMGFSGTGLRPRRWVGGVTSTAETSTGEMSLGRMFE
jgi:hypothetical protein